jgi:hypothetical protein
LNVLVVVFELVDFDVTVTLTVYSTPDDSPEIVILFTEDILDIALENIVELSLSFFTTTFKFTPSFGIAELIFMTIACVASITAKILPAPGSILMEKTIEASTTNIGGGEEDGTILTAPPIIFVQILPL